MSSSQLISTLCQPEPDAGEAALGGSPGMSRLMRPRRLLALRPQVVLWQCTSRKGLIADDTTQTGNADADQLWRQTRLKVVRHGLVGI